MSLASFTKGPVQTIESDRTVAEAARLMCDYTVGALVITDTGNETPLGIITDRDLVWMVAEGLDPKTATVSQFVRSHLQTAKVTDDVSDVTRKMREHGIRRLPILDTEGRMVGIVSLDDLLVVLGREMGDVAAAIGSEVEHEHRIGSARPKGK